MCSSNITALSAATVVARCPAAWGSRLRPELAAAPLAAAARRAGRRCCPAAPSTQAPHCPWRWQGVCESRTSLHACCSHRAGLPAAAVAAQWLASLSRGRRRRRRASEVHAQHQVPSVECGCSSCCWRLWSFGRCQWWQQLGQGCSGGGPCANQNFKNLHACSTVSCCVFLAGRCRMKDKDITVGLRQYCTPLREGSAWLAECSRWPSPRRLPSAAEKIPCYFCLMPQRTHATVQVSMVRVETWAGSGLISSQHTAGLHSRQVADACIKIIGAANSLLRWLKGAG